VVVFFHNKPRERDWLGGVGNVERGTEGYLKEAEGKVGNFLREWKEDGGIGGSGEERLG